MAIKKWQDGKVREIKTEVHDEIEMLRELLDYNPDTGEFRWKYRMGPEALPGAIAGCVEGNGYWRIRVFGQPYAGHRLAFAFIHGKWPDPACDHINGDKLDNRADNLREATFAQNLQNRRTFKSNKSGVKGVCWSKTKKMWRGYVGHKSGQVYCGHFDTVEAAAEAVEKKRRELHGEFARY
jgi:hypothetical protein